MRHPTGGRCLRKCHKRVVHGIRVVFRGEKGDIEGAVVGAWSSFFAGLEYGRLLVMRVPPLHHRVDARALQLPRVTAWSAEKAGRTRE